jgi:hypothetical protein
LFTAVNNFRSVEKHCSTVPCLRTLFAYPVIGAYVLKLSTLYSILYLDIYITLYRYGLCYNKGLRNISKPIILSHEVISHYKYVEKVFTIFYSACRDVDMQERPVT